MGFSVKGSSVRVWSSGFAAQSGSWQAQEGFGAQEVGVWGSGYRIPEFGF